MTKMAFIMIQLKHTYLPQAVSFQHAHIDAPRAMGATVASALTDIMGQALKQEAGYEETNKPPCGEVIM